MTTAAAEMIRITLTTNTISSVEKPQSFGLGSRSCFLGRDMSYRASLCFLFQVVRGGAYNGLVRICRKREQTLNKTPHADLQKPTANKSLKIKTMFHFQLASLVLGRDYYVTICNRFGITRLQLDAS